MNRQFFPPRPEANPTIYAYEDSNYDSNYDGVYDSVDDGVYDEQILQFCLTPRSRFSIFSHLGMSNYSKNWNKHLKPLILKGLITMTLPDKPKSKKQKYQITEAGKKCSKIQTKGTN